MKKEVRKSYHNFSKIKKKGAIELSIGTIVIIVIAMAMLILGLVLVRTIFKGSTDSVSTLTEKVQNEIVGLFADEGADVVVKLGSDRTVRIKPDTDTFGVAIGARTLDGSSADRDRLKYKLTLDDESPDNCLEILGKTRTEAMFKTSLNRDLGFDERSGSNVFSIVQIKVPKGTASCSQKVYIDVTDTVNNEDVGGSFFILEVVKGGLF